VNSKYHILIERAAQKQLAKIPQNHQGRIIDAIQLLASNPRPPLVKKLSGRTAWRIRVNQYRIIYEIHDDELVILVIRIGHRKEVYRD